MHPNSKKCTKKISLGSNGVDRVRSLRKIPTRLCGTNFCTSSARFAPSFVRQPNGPECTQILRNTPKRQFWSDGADRGRSLRKNPTPVRGTNFCTSSSCFAPSFVRQPNGPAATKYYETHQNVSLVSNGVDRVRSLQKIPTRLRGTNFCPSLPVLHRVL